MFPRRARWRATFVLALVILLSSSSIATAGPILISFDVTLSEPGFADTSDSGLLVDNAAVEIDNASGSNVGAPGLFFPDEFINITSEAAMTSLAYMIQGGGDPHSKPGYRLSWEPGTTLLFDSFVFNQPGSTLASVGVTVDEPSGVPRVVGSAGGPLVDGVDYFFDDTSLLINLGLLGVLEQGGTQLGLMTFHLEFVTAGGTDPPVPVSEPASLTVVGMAIAAIGARRRFARPRQ
jgi:hypothetical protein